MSTSLELAIAALVADAEAYQYTLKVAPNATALAQQYGEDSRKIARMIIEAGISARVSLEMSTPEESHVGEEQAHPDQDHRSAP